MGSLLHAKFHVDPAIFGNIQNIFMCFGHNHPALRKKLALQVLASFPLLSL